MRKLTKIATIAALTLVSVSAMASTSDNSYKNTFTMIDNMTQHPIVLNVVDSYGNWTDLRSYGSINAGTQITLQPGKRFFGELTGIPNAIGSKYQGIAEITIASVSNPVQNNATIFTSLVSAPENYKIANISQRTGSLGANVTSTKDVGPDGMQFDVFINPHSS